MILILAGETDAWSSHIHRELTRCGEETVWVQPDQLLDRIALNWSMERDGSVADGTLVIDGRALALDDLSGVLMRMSMPPPLSLDELSAEDRSYVTRETTAAWLALLDALPCAVFNKPVPGGRPSSLSCSVESSRLAQRHGLLLPHSLSVGNKTQATAQFNVWNKRAYVKPLGSQEPGAWLDEHADVNGDWYPARGSVLMQAVPSGQRVTMYVVAGEVVGTVLHPDSHPGGHHLHSPLPTEACARLTQDLGLALAQCELVLDGDQAYCLDLSASPDFWRCPHDIQQRIATSVSDYLSRRRSFLSHDSLVGTHSRFGSC